MEAMLLYSSVKLCVKTRLKEPQADESWCKYCKQRRGGGSFIYKFVYTILGIVDYIYIGWQIDRLFE